MRKMIWGFVRAPDGTGGEGGGGEGPAGAPPAGRKDRPARAAGTGAAGPTDGGGNAVTPAAGKDAAGTDPAPAPAPGKAPGKNALNPPGQPSTEKRARPDWIDDKHWDAETGTVKLRDMAKAYREATSRLSMRTEDLRKADAADRKTMLPKDPREYVPRLHKDYVTSASKAGIKLDADKAVSFDNDPMARMLAVMAHRHGLDQDAFEDMVTLYHHTRTKMAPDPAQERLKLGERAAERAAHVKMQLETRLGRDAAQQFIRAAGGPTAFLVESIERLLTGAGITMPTYTQPGSGEGALDKEKLKAKMRDPRYRDRKHPEHEAIVREVQEGFKLLAGNRPYQPGFATRH